MLRLRNGRALPSARVQGIQDPHGARTKRHTPHLFLALVIVGMLASMTSDEAIVDSDKFTSVAAGISTNTRPAADL